MDRSKLKTEFLSELENNILLNGKNRQFLLAKIDSLPEKMLTILLKEMKKQNKMIDKFIKLAIDNDPGMAEEMKTKSKQFKKKVVELSEAEEGKDIESTLEEKLNQI